MTRYLRLYAHLLRFSFSKAMEFRLDFFFRVGMDMVWYAVHLSFFWLIYRHTPTLGGWTFDQALIFIAGLFVVDAIHMTVFSNNLWHLPDLINRGNLDYYLVRPVSSLFFASVREFAANSFLNLVMAVGIVAWAVARYPERLGAGVIACYAAMLVLGGVLFYVLHILFLIPTFWLHSASGLRDMFHALEQTSGRPHSIYPMWVRRILLTLLPFALMASVPAQILFERAPAGLVAYMTGVVALLFVLMAFFWRRGLRAYASASS